jgi:hypothetical protein
LDGVPKYAFSAFQATSAEKSRVIEARVVIAARFGECRRDSGFAIAFFAVIRGQIADYFRDEREVSVLELRGCRFVFSVCGIWRQHFSTLLRALGAGKPCGLSACRDL